MPSLKWNRPKGPRLDFRELSPAPADALQRRADAELARWLKSQPANIRRTLTAPLECEVFNLHRTPEQVRDFEEYQVRRREFIARVRAKWGLPPEGRPRERKRSAAPMVEGEQ